MLVKKLGVFQFRNIKHLNIETDSRVCIFYGENGSGKTSVLESLFFLGRAKSFRTNKRKALINKVMDSLTISAELQQQDDFRIGISLDDKGNSTIKIDGELVNRLSELSVLLPAQVITPESFDVFFSSPKARRSFLDFGLFHVEHEYQNIWSNYNKLLKQTNALLRKSNGNSNGNNVRELQYWYSSLIEASNQVESFREAFFEKHLLKAVQDVTVQLAENERAQFISELSLSYKKRSFEFNDEEEQQVQIQRQIEKDLRYKQVGFGPSKADINFVSRGEDISQTMSRGQSKMLFYLLEIAMVTLIRKVANKNLLLLVDDLPSEVDEKTRSSMVEMLIYSQAQIFVTGIESKIAMEFRNYTDSVKVFHVEHGTVKPQNMEQLCP